eukprot:NODE_686_length_1261_cov_106.621693_g647_i0.p1 GENE.NODE_686_length_1261_cov_106.621693_g647_i0~~NODE_686_length_1261_cov_106.621693_g647_i0.p1  ORF type:complete len:339 (+),score=76.37 NODE_686_length_1261_cov_106.621693_g647_i0:77-1093(+)
MANLFAQAADRGPVPALVTFKAGKMYQEGKMVIPDKRKGQVTLVKNPHDGILHFQWKDRFSGQMEDDRMCFPGDAKYYRVEKCTTGRVYVLDFTTNRLFFWLQEPKDDKDAELCDKVNKALRGESVEASSSPAGGENASTPTAGNTTPNAPTQSTQPAAPTAARTGGAGSMDALAAALGQHLGQPGMSWTQTQPQPGEMDTLRDLLRGSGSGGQNQPESRTTVRLHHVIDPAELDTLIDNASDKELEDMLDNLPAGTEGQSARERIRENLHCPQFRQSVQLLHAALSDPVAYQEIANGFGLPEGANTNEFGVDPFLDRVESAASEGPKEEKKEDKMQE